jgi:hypothetical protein
VLTVLLGNGSGGIASSHSLPTGSAPRKIVTGDWDGNGSTDLAVVVGGSQALAIHLGNGNGSFGGPTFYGPGAPSASDLATGDLNGDGFAGLAVSTAATPPIMILLGRGDGGFVVGEGASPGGGALALSDLNGDAVLDLAMTSRAGSLADTAVNRAAGCAAERARCASRELSVHQDDLRGHHGSLALQPREVDGRGER